MPGSRQAFPLNQDAAEDGFSFSKDYASGQGGDRRVRSPLKLELSLFLNSLLDTQKRLPH
jgi:hypothetical protein